MESMKIGTKKNTTMAFVTLEDFYGSTELIVFDGVYQKMSHVIVEDNIILVDGRLSIREDEPVKIVASSIREFSEFEEMAVGIVLHNSKPHRVIEIHIHLIQVVKMECGFIVLYVV